MSRVFSVKGHAAQPANFSECLTLGDEGTMMFRNAGNLSLNNTAWHPTQSELSAIKLLQYRVSKTRMLLNAAMCCAVLYIQTQWAGIAQSV